jgi:hypothetical protein
MIHTLAEGASDLAGCVRRRTLLPGATRRKKRVDVDVDVDYHAST